MLKSAYDIKQTPDRSWEKTQYDRNVTSQLWICDIKQMCLQIALENVNGLGTLDDDGERVPERRSGMRKTTLAKTFQAITRCPSRDVYPQIGDTSQGCRATVVMTSKVEPCHVEPCRPATRSCTQLAASVDLSILVLYGHIPAERRQCAQHYSGNVVAETISIHWYHTEGCCNNPNGMSLPNLSFFQSWVCQGTFEFYRWNTADS